MQYANSPTPNCAKADTWPCNAAATAIPLPLANEDIRRIRGMPAFGKNAPTLQVANAAKLEFAISADHAAPKYPILGTKITFADSPAKSATHAARRFTFAWPTA